jgi:hypothetical protein
MMKNKIALFGLFILLFTACKKSVNGISYDNDLNDNENLLEIEDGATLQEEAAYALFAELEEGATIKVLITNLTDNSGVMEPSSMGEWYMEAFEEIGWMISDYEDKKQTFESIGDGTQFIDLYFNAQGSARMDIYENSEEVTRTVNFTWE